MDAPNDGDGDGPMERSDGSPHPPVADGASVPTEPSATGAGDGQDGGVSSRMCWWRHACAGIVALSVLVLLLPGALSAPAIGGRPIDRPPVPDESAEHVGATPEPTRAPVPDGIARFATDANVRALQVLVALLAAGISGGLTFGALRGRWPTSAKGGGFEVGLSQDEAAAVAALDRRLKIVEDDSVDLAQETNLLRQALEDLRASDGEVPDGPVTHDP